MAHFTDTHGNRHAVAITVATLKRVRDELDIDLMTILDEDQKLLADLSDPVMLANLLYVVTGADDPYAFADAIAGDTIDEATKALLEALADFFPGPRGKVLRRAMEKNDEIQAKIGEVVDRKIDEVLDQLGEQFTNSEECSGSTPDRSPSTS